MKRFAIQLALGLCLCAFAFPALAQTAGFADAVLGRWDITVQGADGVSYPSWLEVRLRKENELMASFVGRFGSMRYASKIEYTNGQLTVVIPAQYEAAPKELVFTGKLNGEQLTGTVGDEKGKAIPWTGKRAPALTPAKTVAWGKPIQLFNGKDLTGWKLRNNAHPNCWGVENGVMTNKNPMRRHHQRPEVHRLQSPHRVPGSGQRQQRRVFARPLRNADQRRIPTSD